MGRSNNTHVEEHSRGKVRQKSKYLYCHYAFATPHIHDTFYLERGLLTAGEKHQNLPRDFKPVTNCLAAL